MYMHACPCKLTATDSVGYGAFMVAFDKSINTTTRRPPASGSTSIPSWASRLAAERPTLLAERAHEGHEGGEPGHTRDTLRQYVPLWFQEQSR
jgi:hypothetical protein